MNLDKPKQDDHEAKMARAELYKLNQYSAKLFKLIGENDELDGWVQSKITKAADYISSVYHYMEYERTAAEKVEKGPRNFEESIHESVRTELAERWSEKYKRSVECDASKKFNQRAQYAGNKKII
jgi:hypothetical protein